MSLKSAMESIDAKALGLKVPDDSDIANIHAVFLKALKDIDRFCTDNNIEWSLAGGSMLGAVRQKGFIPWDDDVDIHMPRREFTRFAEAVRKGGLEGYFLACPGDEGYMYHYPKLFIKNTVFREVQSVPGEYNEMFIDVFILEDTPDNRIANAVRGRICMFYMFACSCTRVLKCSDNMLKYTAGNDNATAEIRKRIRLAKLLGRRSVESWCARADRYFSGCKASDSGYIVIPGGARHYFGEMYRRDWICETRRTEFEGMMLPVPAKSEKMLALRYGENYMEVPPPAKRAHHALIELRT